MNPITPGIPNGVDLFLLAADVGSIAIFDVAAGCGPLDLELKLKSVGRIEKDATIIP